MSSKEEDSAPSSLPKRPDFEAANGGEDNHHRRTEADHYSPEREVRHTREDDHWEPKSTRREADSYRPSHRMSSRRSRSRSPDRDRRRSPERRRRSRSRSRSRSPGGGGGAGGSSFRPARSVQERAIASQVAAAEAAKRSQKNCRVYVGNLSYDVKWNTLKDFMRDAGQVVFAEVLTFPNGMSKGCGIVEYSAPEEAQRAIKELSETPLMGRSVFIREDREDEARYGVPTGAGPRGAMAGGFAGRGGFPARGGFRGGFGGGYGAPGYGGGFGGAGGGSNQLYIGNLPYEAAWQDLKDLFRTAGNVIRADVLMGHDGRPKGSGTVVFETAADAQNAIAMYNGFDWNGRLIEVREDRFAGSGPGGFAGGRGGFGPGFPRGAFGGGRGGFRGGFGGRGGFAGRGGFGGAGGGGYGYGAPAEPAEPSTQILVKNLPWSTSNEDLVELFQTTGKVEEAEILFEGGRSKGEGVVQFDSVEAADTAIQKFQMYTYGGRQLDLGFNPRFYTFTAGSAQGTAMD